MHVEQMYRLPKDNNKVRNIKNIKEVYLNN